MSSDMRDQYLV